jgi:hypothetical protein
MFTRQRFARAGYGPAAGNTVALLASAAPDYVPLVATLGGNAAVVGLWDVRYGVTQAASLVTQWDDARGPAGFGPSLLAAGGARPGWNAGSQLITFDGAAQFLRVSGWGGGGITNNCALILVGVGPATIAATKYWGAVCAGSVSSGLSMALYKPGGGTMSDDAAVGGGFASAAGAYTPNGNRRVFHTWRRINGANTDCTVQIGSGTPSTGSVAGNGGNVPTVITIGADFNATAASFGDLQLRAVLLYKGDYISGSQLTTLNPWAVATHGASLL